VAQDNDVVLVMGAGSVSGVAPGVSRGFATHEETAIAADATQG
jgi:UDP-N-acetylmuramate--alanine ligase